MIRLPLILAVSLLAATVAPAGGPVSDSKHLAACRVALDRDLARLQRERETIVALFDADAAAVDAADFTLRKAERAILAELEADRAAAEARHARCRRDAIR